VILILSFNQVLPMCHPLPVIKGIELGDTGQTIGTVFHRRKRLEAAGALA